MDVINNDIINTIDDTIKIHNLNDKTFSELLDLDIVEYIFIILSQIHNINFNNIENSIIDELLNYLNNKKLKPELFIDINQDKDYDYLSDNTDNEYNNVDEIEVDLVNQFTEVKISKNSDSSSLSKFNYVQSDLINDSVNKNLDLFEINMRMSYLKNIILPEQRTIEWYQMRNNMITASDLYKVIGTEGIRRELIIKKCIPIDPNKKVGGGNACKHGIKFEQIATNLYELRNKVKILEFGCIPHSESNFPFGASPDGICSEENPEFAGRMLEIKCPYSRLINGIVPEMYWKQVQGQLEVCNLEFCDFLECKITEYDSEDQFYQDGDEFLTKNNMEKGAIIVYTDNQNNYKYNYAPIGLCKIDLNKWLSDEIDIILEDDNKNFIEICWWRLEIYSCILIKRDRDWFNGIKPKILKFWDEVEYYRKSGIDNLIAKKKKRKKKNEINIFSECLISSDSE